MTTRSEKVEASEITARWVLEIAESAGCNSLHDQKAFRAAAVNAPRDVAARLEFIANEGGEFNV